MAAATRRTRSSGRGPAAPARRAKAARTTRRPARLAAAGRAARSNSRKPATAHAAPATGRIARPVVEPGDLDRALRDDPHAHAAYVAMPPSHRRAYVEFVEEAKRPETRVRRVQQALRMMSQWGAERAERSAKRR